MLILLPLLLLLFVGAITFTIIKGITAVTVISTIGIFAILIICLLT